MGVCGSKPMDPVPILDSVTPLPKKEDPSTRGIANLSFLDTPAIEGLTPSTDTIVLVTSAQSWIGGHVAQALINAGYSVRAAVSNRSSARADFLRDMGCDLVAVPDLLAEEGWAKAMAGCAGFAHVTSLAPSPFLTDAEEMIKEAVEGTELAMRFAAEAGTVRRVVLTGGLASICGSQRSTNPDHLWSEADTNDAPETAFSKSMVAKEAKVWQREREREREREP
ncbi:hypothetical protein T484DRAFT_3316525 [Baffinella frigidus]|nr:hypothetical protein T484DRAFT_3316525 [Cryptophyta sp. CCMP2293]